jgi:hypothetical protein
MLMWEPTRHNNGEGRCFRAIEQETPGDPTGVVVAARMYKTDTQQGKSGRVRAGGTGSQRHAREGGWRLSQMADGFVVPRNPGDAGGGKES